MKVLVTGSAGYVGSILCNELEERKYKVHYYDKQYQPSRLIDYDKADGIFKYIVKKSDVVYHLASSVLIPESIQNPYKYWKNIYGVTNVVNSVCELYDKKLIYISSQVASDEFKCKTCGQHLSPYGASKYFAEQLVLQNPKNLVIRLPNIYDNEGLDPYKERLIPRLSESAKKRGYVGIYPPLDTIVNLIEVHECAKQLADNIDKTGLISINGIPTTILDIANIIAEKYGVKVKIINPPN